MGETIVACRSTSWRVFGLSLFLGAVAGLASFFWGALPAWPGHALELARLAFDRVGVTIVGLLPLGVWACVLLGRQIGQGGSANSLMEMDYGFISRNATLLGLLGTIVALAAAGNQLASDVGQGASGSILKIIPLVGQALISTIVGIVIALLADCALHVIERRRIRETA